MESRIAALAVNRQKTILTWAFVALAGILALAGCRAEEQGRVLSYKAGVYQGQQDAALSEGQIRMLRDRTAMQSGEGSAGGGAPQRNSDVVRPKESETMNWKALDKRVEGQKSEPEKKKKDSKK